MDDTTNEPRLPRTDISREDLLSFFLSHLNRVYCAKNQLVEKLPQLAKQARFLDLRQAIEETVEIVTDQIKRMREIFILLDSFYTYESCTGLIGMLDEAFQSIGSRAAKPELRDLSILFYMQNIESVEIASFDVLLRIANKLNEPEVAQKVRECYDEAKEDKMLFKQIAANYA
jgi:ferritin-like metal-binding protein YciE